MKGIRKNRKTGVRPAPLPRIEFGRFLAIEQKFIKKVVIMGARKKVEKTDGLGPHEIKKIRAAIRLVWHRSFARALVVKRCTGKDGFRYCEKCDKRTPDLKIDHIKQVGDVDGGFIKRLFCSSKELQGLCKKCHDDKTKVERAGKRPKAKVKSNIADFF